MISAPAYPAAWPPPNFLGLPPDRSDWAGSQALIFPIPYEASTSYGGGTKAGPRAILEASAQVELYDAEFGCEPALQYGVHTLPAFATEIGDAEASVSQIAAVVGELVGSRKLLGILGGEHSLSAGTARALGRACGPLVTVQLDAHADLRDTYEGSRWSHACAARRMLESGSLVQLGIRSLDSSEAQFIAAYPNEVLSISADEMHAGSAYRQRVIDRIMGQNVFLTLDVDALDPSIMPATGTPEPGGLSWHQMLDTVRLVAAHSHVLAFDCVELSPIAGLHAPNFAAAKLVYKTLNILMHARAASPREGETRGRDM